MRFANYPTAQLEQKQSSFTDFFEGVRERVFNHRNKQDEIAIQRADAAIAYSVR